MMKTTWRWVIAIKVSVIGLWFAASTALCTAETVGAFSVNAGTLGLGVGYQRGLSDTIDIRVGLNRLSYETDIEENDVTFETEIELTTLSLLADFRPFRSMGFHLSGGLMYVGDDYSTVAKPDASVGSYTFNGTTYSVNDVGSVTGEVTYSSPVAPYLGIGWGRAGRHDDGFSFRAELGVLFTGSPEAKVTVQCGNALSTASCDALNDDVDAEEADLNDELESFNMFPVAMIGMLYSF